MQGSNKFNNNEAEKLEDKKGVSYQEIYNAYLDFPDEVNAKRSELISDKDRRNKKYRDIMVSYVKSLAEGKEDSLGLKQEMYPKWNESNFKTLLEELERSDDEDDNNTRERLYQKVDKEKEEEFPSELKKIIDDHPEPSLSEITQYAENFINEDFRLKSLKKLSKEELKKALENPEYSITENMYYDGIRDYDRWSDGKYSVDHMPMLEGYRPENYATLTQKIIESYKNAIEKLLKEKKDIEQVNQDLENSYK